MKAKKKFYWALTSLAMAILLVGTSVGITIAALQARVQSGFSISYTAKNVEAEIVGTYKTRNTEAQVLQTSEGLDKLTFTAQSNGTQGFEDVPPQAFEDPDDYLEFHYQIKNTGNNPFGVTLDITGIDDASNLSVRFSEKYWNGSTSKPEDAFGPTKFNELYLYPVGEDESVCELGVRVFVKDETKNVNNISGNFNFTLDSSAAEPVNLPQGRVLASQIKTSNMQSITFDFYTNRQERQYIVDGENIIADAIEEDIKDGTYVSGKVNLTSAIEGVKLYKVNDGKDVYILSNGIMYANENCEDAFSDFSVSSLTKIIFNNFNTSWVSSFFQFFAGFSCPLDLSYFDTSNLISFSCMFIGYEGTSLDLSSFNTENAEDMSEMFEYANCENIEISSFNTTAVTNTELMFSGNSQLKTIYVGEGCSLNEEAIGDKGYDLFGDCSNLIGGAGTTYDKDHVDVTYAHVDGGPSNPGYFTYKRAGGM